MAVYQDEFGNWQETPLNLPSALVPGMGAVADSAAGDAAGSSSGDAEAASAVTAVPTGPPTGGMLMGVPISHPSMAGIAPSLLPPTFPAMTGIPGVSALSGIPGGIPVLLPMPQFTAEQLANLNKLNLISLSAMDPDSKDVTAVKPKSTLKPIIPSFKPSIKSQKLEDIEEEDENENELLDSAPNHSYPLMLDGLDLSDTKREGSTPRSPPPAVTPGAGPRRGAVCGDDEKHDMAMGMEAAPCYIARVAPKSAMECLESLRNDLIEDEVEDEWVEIAHLDSAVYPATLWCLHANSFRADPECSLQNLQASMGSALLSS